MSPSGIAIFDAKTEVHQLTELRLAIPQSGQLTLRSPLFMSARSDRKGPLLATCCDYYFQISHKMEIRLTCFQSLRKNARKNQAEFARTGQVHESLNRRKGQPTRCRTNHLCGRGPSSSLMILRAPATLRLRFRAEARVRRF